MASTAKDSYPSATAIEASPHILTLLARLHKESLDQEDELKGNPQMAALRSKPDEDHRKALMADKFIALDADKAAFMYALVRAMGATHVVEVGTSYGVSTIYLALAVGQNAKGGKKGRVVATEHEPAKAKRARAYWRECGKDVEEVVELKEGDLRETLKTVDGQQTEKVDFVLMDSKSFQAPFCLLYGVFQTAGFECKLLANVASCSMDANGGSSARDSGAPAPSGSGDTLR